MLEGGRWVPPSPDGYQAPQNHPVVLELVHGQGLVEMAVGIRPEVDIGVVD